MRDSKYFQTLINPFFAYHSKTCHSSHHHDERPRGSVCFWQHVNDMCGMYAIYFGAHGTPQASHHDGGSNGKFWNGKQELLKQKRVWPNLLCCLW